QHQFAASTIVVDGDILRTLVFYATSMVEQIVFDAKPASQREETEAPPRTQHQRQTPLHRVDGVEGFAGAEAALPALGGAFVTVRVVRKSGAQNRTLKGVTAEPKTCVEARSSQGAPTIGVLLDVGRHGEGLVGGDED